MSDHGKKGAIPGNAPQLVHTPSALGALHTIFSTGSGAEVVKYPKESLILTDGVESEYMFRVNKGRVRVEKGDATTPIGKGAVVNQLQEMQTFGEMSFLDRNVPCANCIADSDDVEVLRVKKSDLTVRLAENSNLARDFYKHMAIAVTQRLALVSSTSAEIPEAPRGSAQPIGPGGLELSAAKLLKVRRRFNVDDTVSMACMMKTSYVYGKTRKHGTLYVFETLIGFVTKVFGIKQHETFHFKEISEVLRESFTIKMEDHGIEVVLTNQKVVTLWPTHVEDAYEAIHRCRAQYMALHMGEDATPKAGPSGGGAAAGEDGAPKGRQGRRGSALVNPEMAFSLDPHAAPPGNPAGGPAEPAPSYRRGSVGPSGSTTVSTLLPSDMKAASAIHALLETATLERYKAGDVIIENGSRHRTLFNVAKGRVAVEVERLNEDTNLMQSVKILTLYEGAIFGEMSFLNGDVACAAVVADGPCELFQIKASSIESMLKDGEKDMQAAFYQHLGTYLTHRVRQLTSVVGEALASRGSDIPLEEVLSNGIFFSHFKRFMEEKRLVPQKLLGFLTDLNTFLDMPANRDQLAFAREIKDKFISSAEKEKEIDIPKDAKDTVISLLASDSIPPRDLFAPVLTHVLANLHANAYRLFTQGSSFQPLLDLKSKEEQVPVVSEFKLLQILGEGYEGKVLQVRKKDCGVCYALKVLDKTILASRSRRWQLHCSRELECLIACNHPYVVAIGYSFQTTQYLYMVQEYLPNHTLAQYLDAHEGRPVAVDEIRFLLAELACGLAHIHSHDIVYRDLKPANVLIDDQGHMRIVDMGMASRLDPETKRRKSVCGTQRYMAPEMKAKEPYNCSVDWYSLGKLALDCQGRSMYGEETAQKWHAAELDTLVEGLLIRDPTKRLASGPEGWADLRRHRFFKSVDWAVVDMRKSQSPLKREWYIRETDLTMSRQFRNGEDISVVVEKLQAMALDGTQKESTEKGPGMVPKWDYVNPRAVYSEYVSSPYLNYKLPLQF